MPIYIHITVTRGPEDRVRLDDLRRPSEGGRLDDPGNAETVLEVLRALHDACPEQYHSIDATPGRHCGCLDRDPPVDIDWPRCIECGNNVEPAFAAQSGGFCGTCLASYGLPLTGIVAPLGPRDLPDTEVPGGSYARKERVAPDPPDVYDPITDAYYEGIWKDDPGV